MANSADASENTLSVLHNLLITNSQHIEAAGLQNPIPVGVVPDLPIVHRPIHFDGQGCGMAVKVHDKPVNDLLAAEVEAVQAIGAQRGPQALLGRRHIAAHGPRLLEFGGVYFLAGDDVMWLHSLRLSDPTPGPSPFLTPFPLREGGRGG